ncbi:methylenetetrahydrofolate reductase [Herbiconiux moechotypicola]|uniref:Methylenetetrahydrofolate reductase n=1 Tax=Herbiconiux moechotypicola TaxID=637393 RepID=A0ABN3DEZ9_9MICO|nr:methylenetetrahydrofolate reductase [Herbiconiux moechotypicola]MCS5729372.1 methylenetetrahydrofolate reductase [Herbiconiux moechotypicola]
MPTTLTPSALLERFSLEMTGKDVPGLHEAAALIPPSTRINVTFLGNEDLPARLTASRAVQHAGFVPVPHVSARRLAGQAELEEFLGLLRDQGTIEDVFVVGGDPHTPVGPYDDSLQVIQTGLLQRYGVAEVGIGGYPEGHPDISDDRLWGALTDKAAALRDQQLRGTVITQFGFDVAPVFTWIERVRERGIDLPVRVGVPGPAGIKRLLAFAGRFGISSSAGIAKKYGFSLTNLLGTAGPDRFITQLAQGYDAERHGEVRLHFYTFGGLKATAEWITAFEAAQA